MTHFRRAAAESGRRQTRVLIAAAIVVLIGLVVFSHRDRIPAWRWELEADRAIARILK
jgi:hypothetical protein